MASNLPAAHDESAASHADDRAPLPARQRISVAFLPLALVTFVILALTIAAWTFLAAAA